MAKRKFLLIVIGLVLLIISQIITSTYQPISDDGSSSSPQISLHTTRSPHRNSNYQASIITDERSSGGSWFDTFKDGTGIENNENINLSGGEVKLELDDENIVLFDNFSTNPLDRNKWDEHIGNGSQFIPSPNLLVLKSEEAQTKEAYLETVDMWQVERIVEWDWKSVLEGGSEGYDHYLYIYHTPKESIWVKIRGDRRVFLEASSNAGNVVGSGPVFTILENTWYKMCCRVSSTAVEFTITDTVGKQLNMQKIEHQITGFGRIKLVFAKKNNNIASFDVRLDNFKMSSGYKDKGDLISMPIELPNNKNWDTFVVNELEPTHSSMTAGTNIRISILDGVTGEPVAGFIDLSPGAFDISDINPSLHMSLALKAILKSGAIGGTPVLGSWGLSWISDNAWQDTFISESKIYESNNLIVNDGEVKLDEGKSYGTLISNTISLSGNHVWNTLQVDKIEPTSTGINITIIDSITNENIDENFIDMSASIINLYSIDPITHPFIRLKADFTGNRISNNVTTPILNYLSLNWSMNTPPMIVSFECEESVLRTKTVQMFVKCSDLTDSENDLHLKLDYRSPSGNDWQDTYFFDMKYINNNWVINFTPDKKATLGKYSIRTRCTDRFGNFLEKVYEEIIEVLNNVPSKPVISIEPKSPDSSTDLKCVITDIDDLEDDTIDYHYEWYRNDELQEMFTDNVVSFYLTSRGDIWKCVVTPFDGNDFGPTGEAIVKIKNSPPKLKKQILELDISEDIMDSTSLNLNSIFIDKDYDKLKFSYNNRKNLGIKINNKGGVAFTPVKDWHGSEVIIFKANDSMAEAEFAIRINVFPVNDPPVINTIHNRSMINREQLTVISKVNQNLYIKIDAFDIDSNKLYYSIKIEDNGSNQIKNLHIDSNNGLIWFQPEKGDVGTFKINVTVRDDNGAFVSKYIRVKVFDTAEPELWYDIQSFVIMGIIILFIIIIILIFLSINRRKKKKRLEAEGTGLQSFENVQKEEKTISSTEMLELLKWRYVKNEIDMKTYNALRKKMLALKGAPIKVSILRLASISTSSSPSLEGLELNHGST